MSISPILYDALMLAVLIGFTIYGAWKGMAWQIATLAALVASTVVAVRFSRPLAPVFSVEEPWNYCLAMLVLYLATSLIIWMLFRLVSELIDRVRLKEFDRQVGALFGLAKGVLWCLVITFFTVTLSEDARQKVLRSYSGYYAAVLIHRASPALPPKVHDILGKYIRQFDEKLHPLDEKLHPQTPGKDDSLPVVDPMPPTAESAGNVTASERQRGRGRKTPISQGFRPRTDKT